MICLNVEFMTILLLRSTPFKSLIFVQVNKYTTTLLPFYYQHQNQSIELNLLICKMTKTKLQVSMKL